MNNDQEIEKEIQEKGLTAPRVTPDHIDTLVNSLVVHSHIFPGTTVTVAAAMLPNGFVVSIAESACASPENFDQDIGLKIARSKVLDRAREELWKMEGYKLKAELAG